MLFNVIVSLNGIKLGIEIRVLVFCMSLSFIDTNLDGHKFCVKQQKWFLRESQPTLTTCVLILYLSGLSFEAEGLSVGENPVFGCPELEGPNSLSCN